MESEIDDTDYSFHDSDFDAIRNFFLFPVFSIYHAISLLYRFIWAFIKNFPVTYSIEFGHLDPPTETDETSSASNNKSVTNLSDLDEIKLNIGGKCFEVSADILKRYDSFFSRMIASDIPHKVDEDSYIIIERDGTHVEQILKFMRTGHIDFPTDVYVVRCIRKEADFYQLEDLIKACDKFLDGPAGRAEACLRAVFTIDERNAAIETQKPIIFLCVGALRQPFAMHDNTCKTITTAMTEFMKNRSNFPQFFFIIDYTPGSILTMDFYFNGTLIQKLHLFNILNNQCAVNIDYQMSSAFTNVMAKMLESAGFGRAVKEDGQLALTL